MSGEKTEQPTPKKERDARQKGQVARSQEVVTTVSLFGVIATIWLMAGVIWEKLVALMDTLAALAAQNDDMALQNGLSATFDIGASILLPVLGVTLAFGIAANYVQVGSLFSMEAIQPKLEKISIAKGVSRIFSMKQLVEMLKSIFKILFLSLLLYIVLKEAIGPFLGSITCGMLCVWAVTKVVTLKLLVVSGVAFIVVAGLDFVYQKHSHTKSLMMSKDEVKREYKESEGDPVVKGQRKQLARELVMSDVKKQVPGASAVVVNPTHIAVAIRYKEGETPLPMVVAKGREKRAQDIRIEAERAGVPIFRNVPLARSLYADTPVDGFVSDEAFAVVAEILAWVQNHEMELYKGPLRHGDLDMERDDHKAKRY
ncbi:type III secretion system export apparatus subunit SctU [Phaeobacter sp. HF9A]|uniref:type III secretion system export apparatus subunit SctU n=1 Tax=Phaeobacter sp. HF9A TaxID=2721561 RepID=UPI0014305A0E|nr:type III secretion system export apparatus subunit SctU [Phaeobacter sp. HF9A]NIZ11989.1 type III secretion system export apparatus subunit SctU [Phaeobacter sp. HF9A]